MSMKRFAGTFLLFVLLFNFFVSPVTAKPSVPERPEQLYVGDFADVLSASTVSEIVDQNEALFDSTGAEIVVVTVDFLDGEDIADYAVVLFNEWGIGSAERDNGLLLLLAIGEDNYYILQGKGLEDTLPSGVLGDMLAEYLEPDFASGDYDAGVRKTFSALLESVKKLYPSGGTAGIVSPPTPDTEDYTHNPRRFYLGDFVKAVIAFITIVVIVSIFTGAGRGRRRRRFYAPPPPPPLWRGAPPVWRRPPPPPIMRRPPPGGLGGGFSRPHSGHSSSGGFSRGGSHRSGGFSHGGSSRGGGAGRR